MVAVQAADSTVAAVVAMDNTATRFLAEGWRPSPAAMVPDFQKCLTIRRVTGRAATSATRRAAAVMREAEVVPTVDSTAAHFLAEGCNPAWTPRMVHRQNCLTIRCCVAPGMALAAVIQRVAGVTVKAVQALAFRPIAALAVSLSYDSCECYPQSVPIPQVPG